MDKADGNYLNGKNPRILHLPVLKNDVETFVEIKAPARLNIEKENLVSINPNENYSVDDSNKKMLQDWLAARYRRHALPGELVRLLKKEGFWKKLTEENSAQRSRFIKQFRLHFEPNGDLQTDERYEIKLLVIHDGTKESRINAEETVFDLKKAAEKLQHIDLSNCMARSTSEVTMDDLEYYEKLNLDYLSHKFDYSDDTQDY